MYFTVLHCVALCRALSRCVALCRAVSRGVALRRVALRCVELRRAAWRSVTMCHDVYNVSYLVDLVCISLSMLGKGFSTYTFCGALLFVLLLIKFLSPSVHIILTSFIVKSKIPNIY